MNMKKVGNTITRKTTVNRTLPIWDALTATGRTKYVTKSVIKAIPTGEGEKKEVHFFKPEEDEYTRPGWISDEDLAKAYERRGLVPDQRAQLAVNADDPSFADEYPNGSHFKDAEGKWCFLACGRWRGDRGVVVDRDSRDWDGRWWFAGVRKFSTQN